MSEQPNYKDDFSEDTTTTATTTNAEFAPQSSQKKESAAVRRKKKRRATSSSSTTNTNAENNNKKEESKDEDDHDNEDATSSTTTTTTTTSSSLQQNKNPRQLLQANAGGDIPRQGVGALKDDDEMVVPTMIIPSPPKQQQQQQQQQIAAITPDQGISGTPSASATPVPELQNNHSHQHESTITAGTDHDDEDDDAEQQPLQEENLEEPEKDKQQQQDLLQRENSSTTNARSRPSFIFTAQDENSGDKKQTNSTNVEKGASSFLSSLVSPFSPSSQNMFAATSSSSLIVLGTKDNNNKEPAKETTIHLEHLSEEVVASIEHSFKTLSRENFETRKAHAYRSYFLRPASMQYSLEDDGKHHSFSPPRPHFKEPREPEVVNDHPVFVKPLVCSVGDVQSVLFRSGVHRIPPMPRLLKFIHKAVRQVQLKEKKRMEEFEQKQKLEQRQELELLKKLAASTAAKRRRNTLKPSSSSPTTTTQTKELPSPLSLFQSDDLLSNTIGYYCRDLNAIHLTSEICLLIAEQMERASNVGCWDDPHEVKQRMAMSMQSTAGGDFFDSDENNNNRRVSTPGDDRVSFQIRRRASAVSIVSDGSDDEDVEGGGNKKNKNDLFFQTADGSGAAGAFRGVSTALMQFKRSLNLSRMKMGGSSQQQYSSETINNNMDPSSPIVVGADGAGGGADFTQLQKNMNNNNNNSRNLATTPQQQQNSTPQQNSLLALKLVKVRKMKMKLEQELAQKENKKKSRKLKKMVKKDSFTFSSAQQQPGAALKMREGVEKEGEDGGAPVVSSSSSSSSSSSTNGSSDSDDAAETNEKIEAETEALANEVGLGGGGTSIAARSQKSNLKNPQNAGSKMSHHHHHHHNHRTASRNSALGTYNNNTPGEDDSEANEEYDQGFGNDDDEDDDGLLENEEDGLIYQQGSNNKMKQRRSSLMMMMSSGHKHHHHHHHGGADVNLALDDPTDAFGENFDDIVVTSEDVRDRLRDIVKGAVKDLKRQRQQCRDWMNDKGIDKRGKLKTAAVPSIVAGNAASQYSANNNNNRHRRSTTSYGTSGEGSGSSRSGSPTGSETNLSVHSGSNATRKPATKTTKAPLTAQERHAQEVLLQLQQIQERQQRQQQQQQQQQNPKHVSLLGEDQRKSPTNENHQHHHPAGDRSPFGESSMNSFNDNNNNDGGGLTKSMTFGSFALSSLRRVSSVNSLEESALRPPKIWTRYGPVSPVIKTGSHIEVATLNFYRNADEEQKKSDERTQRHEELFAQLASHSRKRRGSSLVGAHIDKSPPSLLEANKTHAASSSRGVWSTSASLFFARKPAKTTTSQNTANATAATTPRPPSSNMFNNDHDDDDEEAQLNESRHVRFDREASRRPLWTKEKNVEAPPEVLSARERDSYCRHVAMMRSRPPREPPRDFFLKNTINAKGMLVPTRPLSARSSSSKIN